MVNILLPIQLTYKTFLPSLIKLSQAMREVVKEDCPVASPQKRLEILQIFALSNERIANEYLRRKDGRLFNCQSPDINEVWQPYTQLKEEDARYINDFMTKNYPEMLAIILPWLLKAQSSEDSQVREAACLLSPKFPLESNLSFKGSKRTMTLKYIYNKVPKSIRPTLKRIANKLHR